VTLSPAGVRDARTGISPRWRPRSLG